MAELSSRMQKTASAILPKIAATIAERTSAVRKTDLATAENWLLRPEIVDICKTASQKSLTEAALSYPDGFGGDPKLQQAFASFFNKYFDPVSEVKTQDIVVTPGASNCLDSLLFSLCEAGDSVLVLAPYWSGFDFHFVLRPNINIVSVYTEAICFLDKPEELLSQSLVPALEQAIAKCDDRSRVKALVITNPHNPFARCYPKHVLQEAIHWCGEQGLHYISDEVYAISDFSRTTTPTNGHVENAGETNGEALVNGSEEKEAIPFTSALALELDADKTPSISVIWSTSKDLGSSGFRMGVHVERRRPSNAAPNGHSGEGDAATAGPSLLTTSLGLLSTTQLPTISMLFTHALLTSDSFDTLVANNRQRLREHHGIITRRLRQWGAPFVPATSGPYVLAYLGVKVGDLQRTDRDAEDVTLASPAENMQNGSAKRRRKSVSENEGEDVIDVLRHKALVLVSPGKTFHMRDTSASSEPLEGWARINFAVPADVLEDALQRIGTALALE
ncbi:major facilitator superfamily transporter [Purpureocillium lavendulum]|uniref:Major facilitator superfamily transporter n=1 Tax=Purpureocillium lavendulum TaxID=1247861 RepID=A0AB34G1S5_9HYPO|nr:major facilitator superfamily transporter [Purpureocillium lavendulum]